MSTKGQPKFLKLYEGVTSGTLGGRDDGFPETKHVVYDTIQPLALDFGKRKNEQYFILEPLAPEQLEHYVKEALDKVAQQKQESQRLRDEAEFERLRNKLGR